MQETQVRFLGQEDPLEKGMATHSSILASEITWTEETGELQSMGSHPWLGEAAPQPEGSSVCAQQAPARLGVPGALPQRRVVWMWFGAFPGAFGLGRAQPQRRGSSP